jgi:hypothetical protein
MIEYVGGHWVPFTATAPLDAEQWSVVDAYASFSSAVLAVYAERSTAPLATVTSPQSGAPAMFARFLAKGVDPESLYTSATVEQVSISGCRAKLVLELSYPGGRSLRYVSSWVKPFDRAAFPRHAAGGAKGPSRARLAALLRAQHAPWLFVGDNRVGGVTTPCGV